MDKGCLGDFWAITIRGQRNNSLSVRVDRGKSLSRFLHSSFWAWYSNWRIKFRPIWRPPEVRVIVG